MKKINLSGAWQFREAASQSWHDATVPGSVTSDLLAAGLLEDPYYRDNEWKTLDALMQDYEYKRNFTVDNSLSAGRCELRFYGLDTVAKVSLNGEVILLGRDMHKTYAAEVTGLLKSGENELNIYFTSPAKHALALHKANPTYTTRDTIDGFCQVRKAHCMYGWDWGPQLPDMGIWRDIELVELSGGEITDLYVTQLHSANAVKLCCRIEAKGYTEAVFEAAVTVTSPSGQVQTVTASLAAGEVKSLELEVTDPQLWWPNGYGEQPLYKLRATLTADGREPDCMEQQLGLRTMTVAQDKDQWGESFAFCVNGVSIFAMGANYIPEDSILSRCSRERTDLLLEQCVAANFNCIRVWGGGFFCHDYFYELCDQKGLIVWQDLLFACGVYHLTDTFVEDVIAETEQNMRRLRHHACLGLWCGNNELEWGWWGWDMGFGDSPYDKADYIKLFEYILPETAKRVDPSTFYWLASPSSGGSFDDPNDQNRGDVHYWDVWHRLKPFTEYRKFHFRFCSEFGFQSFPCLKTVKSFTLPEDRNIFSYVMEQHQKNGSANGRILSYLSDNFLYPAKFETLLYASQVMQAEAIRYGVEHWRSNRGRCMGSLYWQLNDCWPVASWASIDYFGRWKPLHYYAKRFYAPLMLAALEERGEVSFVVCNEARTEASCTVGWRLMHNDGRVLQEGQIAAAVPALSAATVLTASFAQIAANHSEASKCYLEYTLSQGAREIGSHTLLFLQPKHFSFENPNISISVWDDGDCFDLCVRSTCYAKYVMLDSPDFDFVADDNCFDLSPDREKHIRIAKTELPAGITQEQLCGLEVMSAYDIR